MSFQENKNDEFITSSENILLEKIKKESLLAVLEIINISSIDDISNIKIKIETLHNQNTLDKFRELIPVLKKIYSSDKLTCLHANSRIKQKNPGVNFLRQILKANGFDLKSKSIYKGFHYEQKKHYRFYYIVKLKK